MLKIAIQLRTLRQPFQQALLTAKRLGAQGVEIDARGEIRPRDLSETGLRQVRKLLADLDLPVVGVGFATRQGYDVSDQLERRVEATKEALTFARKLGASHVINQVGQVPADLTTPRGAGLLEMLRELATHGNHVGAWLTYETGSESGGDLARLLAALPAGGCPVALNPGNLIINGFAPLDAVEALGSSISYVRAKDGVRDLARGRGLEVDLGRGTADFPALVGTLDAHGYRGWYTVARDDAQEPLVRAGQAVQYLNSL